MAAENLLEIAIDTLKTRSGEVADRLNYGAQAAVLIGLAIRTPEPEAAIRRAEATAFLQEHILKPAPDAKVLNN